MSGAHTPGPLTVRVGANGDVGIIAPAQQAVSAHDIGGALVAECFSEIRRAGEGARAEALANATLYAASPELLKAAKAVAFSNGFDAALPDKLEALRAAIAKATGAAP
ncbi:hypothetical protein [Polaromonas sp.]|uniref:hypothetical protein n=1 Tax=Polaromonas sp. TaxID=1869339 RepID=UPI003752CD8A